MASGPAHSSNGATDGEKPNNFPPPVTSPSLSPVLMGSEDSASGSGCLLNRTQAQGQDDSRDEQSTAAPSHHRSAIDIILAAPPSPSHEGGSLQDVPARGCGLVGSQASTTSPPPSVQPPSARCLRSPPLVYTHRQAGIRAATPRPSTAEVAPVTPQGASFIRRMSKTVGGGAPRPPQVQKHHVKTMPLGITPRCSKSLAGIGAEQHHHCPLAAPSRSKKVLMNTLGMVPEEANVSSTALQKYAEFFSNPLSAIQIKALVTLFGWCPPEGLEGQGRLFSLRRVCVFGSFVFVLYGSC
jgi:hypothetical protein